MNLQEQRNHARARNKSNKLFIQGLQDFLGSEWKLQYKSSSRKFGASYIRHISLRIENKSYYCLLHFPDFQLDVFDVNSFDLSLRHFNNIHKSGIQKDFYEQFLRYKDIVNLHDNLEAELPSKAEKRKTLKI